MNPAELRWKSGAVGHATELRALVPEPERHTPPWPVLYLLHGRTDDATAWTRYTTLERQADAFPFVIVMPAAYVTFYRDPVGGHGMETSVIRELIPLVEATFNVRRDRGGRHVAGLSMGGYGALWLGVRHPHLFASVSAHSAAAIESRRGDDIDRKHHTAGLWGNPPREELTLAHAFAHADRAALPRIRMDCGDRDPILEESRILHAHLRDCGIEHTYVERPGGHDWNYWERVVGETLRFCMTALSAADAGGGAGGH